MTVSQLEETIWASVKNYFRFDTSRAGTEHAPYLWYGPAVQVFDQISNDFYSTTGQRVHHTLRDSVLRAVDGYQRVGLTIILGGQDVTLPGMLISDQWQEIISHVDRILLHENVNAALMRNSCLYQMGAYPDFLNGYFKNQGGFARNLLAKFTEMTGTVLTEVLQRELDVPGTYLVDRPFFVDSPSSIPESDFPIMHVLIDLIEQKKYDPVNHANNWLGAVIDEICNSQTQLRGQAPPIKKKLLSAADEFKRQHPYIKFKIQDGSWARVRNR